MLLRSMFVKSEVCFIYGINIPSRWGTQAPFSQITLDWNVPQEFINKKAIVAGCECDFTYGDCQKEMKILHDALFEVINKGDVSGCTKKSCLRLVPNMERLIF